MKILKTALLALVMFIGAAFVPAKAHAQIGPFPCGGNSDISTFRPEVPYFTGQVVIRYGVSYQSLSDNNQGNEPCFSPSQWSNTLSGAGGASLSTTSPQTFRGPIAASTNGTLNESLFSGGSVTARVLAACNTLTSPGVIVVPPTETATDFGFSLLPPGCAVQDQRGIIYPKYTGYYLETGINQTNSFLDWVQWTRSNPAVASNPLLRQMQCEAQTGGYNTFNGTSGVKTNYDCLFINMVSRTPGQHNPLSVVSYNLSDGDHYTMNTQMYDMGQATANGDEGAEFSSQYLFTGLAGTTASVTAINGSTITLSCIANCDRLGEGRNLLNTSRGEYTTGTVSGIAGTPPIISGSGTTWTSLSNGAHFFEFNAEIVGGVHVTVPIASVTNDTSITLSLINQNVQVPYTGKIASGAYTIYQGSTITKVPYTAGVYTTIYATVADPTQFQVGDNVMEVGSPVRNSRGFNLVFVQDVPTPANQFSTAYPATSSGNFPINWFAYAIGAFKNGIYGADWRSYSPPVFGIELQGAIPSSFAFFNDPALNNLENMLSTDNSAGTMDSLSYDRTNGNNRWQMNHLYIVKDATIPVLNGGVQAGQVFNGYGAALGIRQNLALYSQFDSASIGSTWATASGTAAPASITSNTTAVTDPNGGNTAEAFVAPSTFGAATASGQSQAISLTSGLPYSLGVCFRGAAGGEQVVYGFATGGYDAGITLTTSWQCVGITATPSGTITPGFLWYTSTLNSTIYVAFAQVEQAISKGIYLHTTGSAITATDGVYATSINNPNFATNVLVCTDGFSNLTTTSCPTGTGVSAAAATAPITVSQATGAVTVTCPTCATGSTISSSSDVANTTFTAEQALCSLTIPANSLSGTQDGPLSRITFHASVTTSGSGSMTVGLNLNTSNVFAGASRVVGPSISSTAGRTYVLDGQCHMRGSASMICDATILNTSNLLLTNVLTSTTFSVGSPMYWVISGTQTVSGDTTTCREMQARIY